MTTQTLQTHREQMLRWLEEHRPYEFLNMAEPYLAVCPHDHHVALIAAREYLSLGLIDPARDLIEQLIGARTAAPQLQDLRDQLQRLSSSVVPWPRFASRFETNLAVLEQRGGDAGSIRAAWASRCGRFQLFNDSRGSVQVRTRTPDGASQWLPALRDHLQADRAQPLPDDITVNTPGPYLFDGLGLGGLFERIYGLTKDTFLGFSCALLIVEPDPADLAVALHLSDWSRILADPRVFPFVGDGWADRLRATFDELPNLPIPAHVLTTGPRDPNRRPRPIDVIGEVFQRREATIRASWEEVERQYADKDLAHWGRRFDQALCGGEPLRILAAVSTHTTFLQHSMRDTQRALHALGHQCRVLTEDAAYEVISPLKFHEAVRDFEPDLFLALDHIRPEFRGVIPTNLPILCWDQDQLPHVFTSENVGKIPPHDFLVGCSKSFVVTLGLNPEQMRSARMPTCPDFFGGPPLTDEEAARHACDVSYVSHASQTPKQFHDQERAQYQDRNVVRLLDTMYDLLPQHRGTYGTPDWPVIQTVLAEAMNRCHVREIDERLRNRLTQWYLWRLGDRIFRHETLQWVADWARRSNKSFRIHGNGWDEHPTLAGFAAGPAANGRELLCVYRASRINLQLMPAGFLHQRALDGLAAGGFFLTRATRSDLAGRKLRELLQRIDELGITDTDALLESEDEALRNALQSYMDRKQLRAYQRGVDLLEYLRIAGEIEYADEVFPDFERIVFDSASAFEMRADHFLKHDAERIEWARAMREVAVTRFSYKAAVERFLRAMRGYLRTAASVRPDTDRAPGRPQPTTA